MMNAKIRSSHLPIPWKDDPTEVQSKLISTPPFDFVPHTLEEAMKFSEFIAKSDLVSPTYQNKPGNILLAIQMGLELGLKPLQALQNIAVINGRPTIWGDAMLALVKASPVYEWITEQIDQGVATCVTQRKGDPNPVTRSFSMAQAKQAGLLGKAGPWSAYPERMLQLRARAFCLRDVYPDVLKGMCMYEEVEDEALEYLPTVVMPKRIRPRVNEDMKALEVPPMPDSPAQADTMPCPSVSRETPPWTKTHATLWNSIVDTVGSANGVAERKLQALCGASSIRLLSEADARSALEQLRAENAESKGTQPAQDQAFS